MPVLEPLLQRLREIWGMKYGKAVIIALAVLLVPWVYVLFVRSSQGVNPIPGAWSGWYNIDLFLAAILSLAVKVMVIAHKGGTEHGEVVRSGVSSDDTQRHAVVGKTKTHVWALLDRVARCIVYALAAVMFSLFYVVVVLLGWQNGIHPALRVISSGRLRILDIPMRSDVTMGIAAVVFIVLIPPMAYIQIRSDLRRKRKRTKTLTEFKRPTTTGYK